MELTVEEKLLRHQIQVADGPITVDAAKLRTLLFLAEDDLNDEYQRGHEEGFAAGLYQGTLNAKEAIKDFADEL
jgi:hypothetical protein